MNGESKHTSQAVRVTGRSLISECFYSIWGEPVIHIPYLRLDCNLMQLCTVCGQQVTFSSNRLFSSTSSTGKGSRQRHLGVVAGVWMFTVRWLQIPDDKHGFLQNTEDSWYWQCTLQSCRVANFWCFSWLCNNYTWQARQCVQSQ